MKTRKQHLIERLTNHFNFIYIEPYKKNEHIYYNNNVDNIIVYTIPTFKLGSKILGLIFNFHIIRKIIFLFQKLYLKKIINNKIDVQIISNPSFIQLINKNIPIIWDYNDNPFQFAKPPNWLYKSFESFLFTKINKIWASSKYLNDKFNNKNFTDVDYIPNGVDIDFGKNVKKIYKKDFTIGYVGIISSWFFDFELIKSISIQFPNIIIRLIGPKDPLAQKKIKELYKFKNISIEEKVDYSDLPEIMSSFNIGIIPLKQMKSVYQLNSAKILQYLAVGIPVISVPFFEFKEFKDGVYFCNSNIQYINSIKEIIKDKAELKSNNINLENFYWGKISNNAQKSISNLIKKT